MASKGQPALTVIYSATALGDLDEIWDWNAKTHGPGHAAQYIEFLEQHINALSRDYGTGQVVSARPDLRYLIIRRKNRGHGHVAVYRFDDHTVSILHVFHTAQDWRNKVSGEEE